jgi:hypothetical protein
VNEGALRRAQRIGVAIVIALGFGGGAGCSYSPNFQSGITKCATSGQACPSGFTCNVSLGVCISNDAETGSAGASGAGHGGTTGTSGHGGTAGAAAIGGATGTGGSVGATGSAGRGGSGAGGGSGPGGGSGTGGAAGAGGTAGVGGGSGGSAGSSGGGSGGGGAVGIGGAAGTGGAPAECAVGATRKCSEGGALGNCGKGQQSCVAGKWGACDVVKAAADSCAVKGDDANCNGLANDTCPCVTGDTQACGPAMVGICKPGTAMCANGSWGNCVGAVIASTRDCTSAADNDCDGRPDNTIDLTCACTPNMMRACDTHPGKDGVGPCKAGSQTCVLAANKASSSWSGCTGAVAPAATDACIFGNDDMCTGVPVGSAGNTQCQCGGFPMPNAYSAGLPNRASYTANADGTVTDNVTGFTWEGTPDASTFTNAGAATYCSGKTPLGTWRLPSRLELVSILDATVARPAPLSDAVFKDMAAGPYWTSRVQNGLASFVNFINGFTDEKDAGGLYHARCIRSSPPRCYPKRYTVQSGGVVLDNATGLSWQQTPGSAIASGATAMTYCAGLGSGWRVPSINEAQTIFADDGTTDPTAFPAGVTAWLWTSTPYPGNTKYYLAVKSYLAFSSDMVDPAQVFCVRWH